MSQQLLLDHNVHKMHIMHYLYSRGPLPDVFMYKKQLCQERMSCNMLNFY